MVDTFCVAGLVFAANDRGVSLQMPCTQALIPSRYDALIPQAAIVKGMTRSLPSIRAASWAAAQCLRHFCKARQLEHVALDDFCHHLEQAATAESLPAWDAQAGTLVITGLGDPLPHGLQGVAGLNELVCAAREITASAMYGDGEPAQMLRFLSEVAMGAGLVPGNVIAQIAGLHDPRPDGWGMAVTEVERSTWTLAP